MNFLISLFLFHQSSWGNPFLSQKVTFPSTSVTSDSTILYGTNELGFFKVTRLKKNASGIWETHIIPPSYTKSIQFLVDKNGQRKLLTSKKFNSPPNHPPPLTLQVRGTFSFPFFQTGLLSKETSPLSYYPAVLNRYGEIVWYDKSHFRPERNLSSSTNLSVLPWKSGLIVRGAGENSVWNLISWDGQRTELKDLTLDGRKLAAHHSMGSSNQEVFMWTVMSTTISPFKDTIPVFSGIWGWFRAWGEQGRQIIGSRLIALNPETGLIRSIATSFDWSTPQKSPSRSLDENMDRFQDVTSLTRYRALKNENDPEAYIPEDYDTDWTHENAVDVTPEGNLLVTLRNLNSILLLSPTGKILWAIGEEHFSTHRWADTQSPLGLPHSARWLSENRIAIFDNGAPYRGMRYLPSQSRVLWLELQKDGTIKVEKEILLPGDKSLTKGSLRSLKSNGFLVWHPGPNTAVGQALETSADGEVLAHVSIVWPWHKKHDEMLPVYDLGDPLIIPPKKELGILTLDAQYDNEVY